MPVAKYALGTLAQNSPSSTNPPKANDTKTRVADAALPQIEESPRKAVQSRKKLEVTFIDDLENGAPPKDTHSLTLEEDSDEEDSHHSHSHNHHHGHNHNHGHGHCHGHGPAHKRLDAKYSVGLNRKNPCTLARIIFLLAIAILIGTAIFYCKKK